MSYFITFVIAILLVVVFDLTIIPALLVGFAAGIIAQALVKVTDALVTEFEQSSAEV